MLLLFFSRVTPEVVEEDRRRDDKRQEEQGSDLPLEPEDDEKGAKEEKKNRSCEQDRDVGQAGFLHHFNMHLPEENLSETGSQKNQAEENASEDGGGGGEWIVHAGAIQVKAGAPPVRGNAREFLIDGQSYFYQGGVKFLKM